MILNKRLTLRRNNKTIMESIDKKTQILEVAQKLFAKNGFDGTSVRDIAKEADVNIAMISYYFGSKEKLLEAVFEKHSNYIRLQLESLIADDKMEPMQKVYQLIDSYLQKYFGQMSFHKIVLREQMANKLSCATDMLLEMKRRNQELVKQIIKEGQKKGVFKKNIDIPMMMATMLGTANQVMTTLPFYKEVNNLADMPEEEFQKLIKKKLTLHLKSIFKAILTYEEQ